MPYDDYDDQTEPASLAEVPGASREHGTDAGLVLVYAEAPERIPSAFVLDADSLIGRGAANLVIPHPTVSRLHARITRTPEGFVLRDLGSRNGVLLGNRRIDQALLRPNDEIRIGDALFKFVTHGARAYADYSIAGRVAAGAARVKIPGAVGGMQMARLSAEVEAIASSNLSLLVLGETGTGKELVARAVHAASGRTGQFRGLNCAAIPANLVESELFGYKRGAFSGADRDHLGIIRAANGGTLLLDEIGDMQLDAQAKLLRTVETREVVPVGGVAGERVDVRFVSATHRDLRAAVDAGSFRGDLFARLNAYSVRIPPLRERKEDILMLVRHFLEEAGAGDRTPSFAFMVAACQYSWPFNVRELAAAVKRAATVSSGPLLEVHDLPEAVVTQVSEASSQISSAPSDRPPTLTGGRPSLDELTAALREHGGNVAAVGRALRKDRAQVHRWMRHYGVDPSAFR
jgi:transcriptional regulator with GAF, ATPase, and Fis domain